MMNHPLFNKIKKLLQDSLVKACNITIGSNKIKQEPIFKKMECYNVDDPMKKKKAKYLVCNLETDNPEMISLSEGQRVFLLNYINKNFHDHLQGEFYLEDDKVKIFRKVQNGLEHKEKIQKAHVKFILLDIQNSFERLGYSRDTFDKNCDLFE